MLIDRKDDDKSATDLRIHVATPSDDDEDAMTSSPAKREEGVIEVLASPYALRPGIKQWSSYQNLFELTGEARSEQEEPAPPFTPGILQRPVAKPLEVPEAVAPDPVPPAPNNDLDSGVGNDVESQESLPDTPTAAADAANHVTVRKPPPIAPKPAKLLAPKPPAPRADAGASDVTTNGSKKKSLFRDKLERMMQQKQMNTSSSTTTSSSKLRRLTSPVPPSFSAATAASPSTHQNGRRAFDALTADGGDLAGSSDAARPNVHARIRQRLSTSSSSRDNNQQQQQRFSFPSPLTSPASAAAGNDVGEDGRKCSLEEQLGQLLLSDDERSRSKRIVYDRQCGTGGNLAKPAAAAVATSESRDFSAKPANWRAQLLDHLERKRAERFQNVRHPPQQQQQRHVGYKRCHSTDDQLAPASVGTASKFTARRASASNNAARLTRTRTPAPDHNHPLVPHDITARPKSAMGAVYSAPESDERQPPSPRKPKAAAPPSYEDHMMRKAQNHHHQYYPLRQSGSHESVLNNGGGADDKMPPMASPTTGYGAQPYNMRTSNSHDSLLDSGHYHYH
ncbi:MAG: hypothetical protein AAFP26_11420, partial [Planctomycetota bacterium]